MRNRREIRCRSLVRLSEVTGGQALYVMKGGGDWYSWIWITVYCTEGDLDYYYYYYLMFVVIRVVRGGVLVWGQLN